MMDLAVRNIYLDMLGGRKNIFVHYRLAKLIGDKSIEKIIAMIRDAIECEREKEGWTDEFIRKKLGLSVVGTDIFMRQAWSLDRAVRTAIILGIEFSVKF